MNDCKNFHVRSILCPVLTDRLYCIACSRSYKEKKEADQAEKQLNRQLENEFQDNQKPCMFAYRSEKGCIKGEDCRFSHDYNFIEEELNLHACIHDQGCAILCEDQFDLCQKHNREKKQAETAAWQERKTKNQTKKVVDKKEWKPCDGPNCRGKKAKAVLVPYGFCDDVSGNGCREAIREYAPPNHVLLSFGRGVAPPIEKEDEPQKSYRY